MTRAQLRRLLPKGIEHLSMGEGRCSFILCGKLETVYYSELEKFKLRQALRSILTPIDSVGELVDDVVLQICDEVLKEFHR